MPKQPKFLKNNGKIGLLSPAWWVAEDIIQAGAEYIEKLGFQVEIHPQNYLHHGQLAGTVEERIDAIHEYFSNSEIDGIMFTRGGYGSLQLLQKLDYELIKTHPKIIMGFSDVTGMLNAIACKSELITYHGPTAKYMFENLSEITKKSLLSALVEGRSSVNISRHGSKILQEGIGIGTIIGGNMCVFDQLIGTEFFPQNENIILFLEEANNEKINELDKKLLHLKHAGIIPKIKGLILGGMEELGDNKIPFGFSVKEISKQYFPPNIPIITNVACGHGENLLTFPIGATAKLEIADSLAFLSW